MKNLAMLSVGAALLFAACSGDDPVAAAADQVFVYEMRYGVLPYAGFSYAIDGFMESAVPSASHGADQSLTIKYEADTTNRAVFWFDMANLVPFDARVKRAVLTLYGTAVYTYPVQAYRITEWVGATPAWSDWTGAAQASLSYCAATPISPAASIDTSGSTDAFALELDTAVVQGWMRSQYKNYGILVRCPTEGDGSLAWVQVHSAESTIVDRRPKMTIYYSLP